MKYKLGEHRVHSYEILDRVTQDLSAYTRSEFTGDAIVDCIFLDPEPWGGDDEFRRVVNDVFGDSVEYDQVIQWGNDYDFMVFYK